MLHELQQALVSLRQDLRFSVVAISTLALGIGACTAIFSVVYGVLLHPLPYPQADRLAAVWQVNEGGRLAPFSDPNFEDVEGQNRSFTHLAQHASAISSVVADGTPVRTRVATVSREFFAVFSVAPRLGRLFGDGELREGAPPVAVVSYGFFQRHLGADADLSRHRLGIGGRIYDVVGVMPPAFDFPAGASVWLQRELFPRLESRTAHNWSVVGRLDEEVSAEEATADLNAVAGRLRQELGEDTWMRGAAVVPLLEEQTGDVRSALWILLGAVGSLLLVACANVANLLLARVAGRQRELAVRSALGAGRLRIVRLFLAEALVVALLAGGLGVLLAALGIDALLSFEPGSLPRVDEVGVSLPVLGFAVGLSTLTALGLGVGGAAYASSVSSQDALRAGAREGGGGRGAARLRGAFVTSQLAVTVVLLVGAGLLGRSLWELLGADPGFQSAGRLVMEISHPGPETEDDKRRLGSLQQTLLERLQRLPGVRRAGAVDRLPFATGRRNGLFLVLRPGEELPPPEKLPELARDPERTGTAEYRAATPGYFETLGIPLLEGRLFSPFDEPDGTHVALVSESLVASQWPDEDPLGKRIEFGNMDGDLRLLTVVGVVGDVRHTGLDRPPQPTIYTHAYQRPPSSLAVVLDTEGVGEDAIVGAARRVLGELDPGLPAQFRRLGQVVGSSLADRRFNLILVAAFGGCALLLASSGIYGVTAYSVNQRRREFGIRFALGADGRQVLSLVLRRGALWVAGGLALGLGGAAVLSRVLQSLLFGIEATDAVTYLAVSLTVSCLALSACAVPARRAGAVDPVVVLRDE